MLVGGLNDSESALSEISAILKDIQPDEVHLLQPTRPPAETWVKPADEEGLLRAQAILGDVARVVHPASGSFDLSGAESLVDAVIGIITRHPMREDELVETLKRFSPEKVSAVLKALEKSGKAQVVERFGVRFWSASPAYYPSEPK
jgi:wyosine [tRNA(Phe)-imidazoG37] synthetase (radical SAM superfamily)